MLNENRTFEEMLDNLDKASADLREKHGITVAPLNDAIAQLRKHTVHIRQLEDSKEAIKDELVAPLNEQLAQNRTAGRFSIFGFWVGAFALVISIGAIIWGAVRPIETDLSPTAMQNIESFGKEILNSAAEPKVVDGAQILESVRELQTGLLFPESLEPASEGERFIAPGTPTVIAASDGGSEALSLRVLVCRMTGGDQLLMCAISIHKNGLEVGRETIEGAITRHNSDVAQGESVHSRYASVSDGDVISLGPLKVETIRVASKVADGRLIGDQKDGVLLRISERAMDD